MPPSQPQSEKCRTCKCADPEDGEIRCRACHARFRRWLAGDDGYQPLWNGVIEAPANADKPQSRLDRALARKQEN